MLRAVVLDFDGVVLESNEAKTTVFREVFSRFPEHVDAMMAFHRDHAWASRFVKFDHLLNRLGRQSDTTLREELASEFSQQSVRSLMAARFVAGAESFLKEFSTRVPLYLASNTPVDDLARTLHGRGVEAYFTTVYGCPPWRKTEAVLDVSHRIGCEPAEIVLIGDSQGDQEAAARAGAEFVWRRSDIQYDDPPGRGFDDLEQIADFLRPRLA